MSDDPHAELRKTYQPGQHWEWRSKDWSPCRNGPSVFIEPCWRQHNEYRLIGNESSEQPVRMLTKEETIRCRQTVRSCGGSILEEAYIENIQRNFCEINAGRTIPASGKLEE